ARARERPPDRANAATGCGSSRPILRGNMFIQTQAMPSPAELKFLPGCEVLAGHTVELRDRADAARSTLARRLFQIPGVSAVVLGPDFITVTKRAGECQALKPAILGAIADHFSSGAPVVDPRPPVETGSGPDGLAEEVTD